MAEPLRPRNKIVHPSDNREELYASAAGLCTSSQRQVGRGGLVRRSWTLRWRRPCQALDRRRGCELAWRRACRAARRFRGDGGGSADRGTTRSRFLHHLALRQPQALAGHSGSPHACRLGDFAMAFYNPISKARPGSWARRWNCCAATGHRKRPSSGGAMSAGRPTRYQRDLGNIDAGDGGYAHGGHRGVIDHADHQAAGWRRLGLYTALV